MELTKGTRENLAKLTQRQVKLSWFIHFDAGYKMSNVAYQLVRRGPWIQRWIREAAENKEHQVARNTGSITGEKTVTSARRKSVVKYDRRSRAVAGRQLVSEGIGTEQANIIANERSLTAVRACAETTSMFGDGIKGVVAGQTE